MSDLLLPSTWKDENPEETITGEQKKIMLMLDKKPRNKSEISNELGISRPTVYKYLKPLKKKGVIREKGNSILLNEKRVNIEKMNSKILQDVVNSSFEKVAFLFSIIVFLGYSLYILRHNLVAFTPAVLSYNLGVIPLLLAKIIFLYRKEEYTRVVAY